MDDHFFMCREQPDLLVRPPPGRTEGPDGYLFRLAEANCMTVNDLTQLGVRFDREWLSRHRLLPEPALDPDLHAHVARIAHLKEVTGRIWNQRFVRFCPLCLAEDPTWRAGWELYFHDACPRHGVWLIDHCGSCTQPLKWRRDSLLRCQCGSDLREDVPCIAPAALRRLSAVLERKLFNAPTDDDAPPLAGLDVDQTQRLIRYLGTHLDPFTHVRPLKLRNAGCLENSWPVSTLAAEVVFGWPQAFHRAWSRLQESSASGEKKGLTGTFHSAYQYLYKGLREAEFDPVRDAFERWMAAHWKGGIAGRNRRLPPDLLKNVQWIPGKVAADKLGISSTRLRHLIREGKIEGEESLSTTGRSFLVVRRDQLDRIDAELAGEITMAEAMEMLGIGKVRMQRLLRLLFPTARRVWEAEYLPWRIPRGEVEALLEAATNLPVVGIPEEHQVSLGYVLKYWNWTGEEILALVEAVKGGSLQPQSFLDSARGISRWVFDVAQLRTLQRSLGLDRSNWVSIPEMARMLGVKQQVAYWLTHHGFVRAEFLGRLKNLGSRIRRDEIERFRQNHIFGREIAAIVGRSPGKVIRMLAEQGIYPLRVPTEPSRMAVYVRGEEVRRFLAQMNSASPGGFRLVSSGLPNRDDP